LLPGEAKTTHNVIQFLERFNPHPALLPGEALISRWAQPSCSFQSAPGIAAG